MARLLGTALGFVKEKAGFLATPQMTLGW